MHWKGKGVVAACIVLPLAASAQIGNGGFEESPIFNHWATYGDAQILGSSIGSGPTEGVSQALVATATDGTVNADVVPGSGTTEADLEAGLGLASSSLSTLVGAPIVLASGISQTVTVAAGDKVDFDWDFLTNQTFNDGTADSIAPDARWNDFSFFSVSPTGNPAQAQIFILADTFFGYAVDPGSPSGFDTGFTITPVTDPFISETGYRAFEASASAGGSFVLGFGVGHVVQAGAADDGVNSGLLVDNVRLAPVPEPVGALTLGFGVLATTLRRRMTR